MSENNCLVYAFANQKGGVGKTTSAVNIAASVAALGKKTLLVDMDPQGNATSGVGLSKKEKYSVYDVLTDSCNPEEAVFKTEFENLWCMPSNIVLAGAEVELVMSDRREGRMKDALKKLYKDFDCIMIDCPPSLGLLTINALCAASRIVVPMQCEYYALEGLSQLTITVSKIKKMYNPSLSLCGVIITMFDGRLNLSAQVLEEIKKHFPGKIFKTPVPRNVRLSEAPSYGKPALYYDKHSKGAAAYTEIAKELIERA